MTARQGRMDSAELDSLIEEITVDAYGDEEKFWAFRQAFEDDVAMPAAGFVIGEPVSVVEIDYDGDQRHGLTARCRREDGSEHRVAACDVVFPVGSIGARHQAAYRRWLNLDPYPAAARTPRPPKEKTASAELDLSKPIELVALSVKERNARCRVLGSDQVITLRPTRIEDVVPGEIVTVIARKQWRYAGHPYLSGEIQSVRVDAAELGLEPLGIQEMGIWDPEEHYWGEADEPLEEWAKRIIARGPRQQFEMGWVLPGEDPDDPFTDPIIESNDLKAVGDLAGAKKILMDLCQADLRCLDAHAHLGNLLFRGLPKRALRHYLVGFSIGEFSLPAGFDGVLPWGLLDNRPFLRCMHGYGLSLWRMERFDDAEKIFERMLWLNPSDEQGVRILIDQVRRKIAWEDLEDD